MRLGSGLEKPIRNNLTVGVNQASPYINSANVHHKKRGLS